MSHRRKMNLKLNIGEKLIIIDENTSVNGEGKLNVADNFVLLI